MRRILLVLFIAATAVGVGVQQPAKAVSMPCSRPMQIPGPVGLGSVGIDLATDTSTPTSGGIVDPTVCITTWLGTTYEVNPGLGAYLYGTDGQGGAWLQTCERSGTWYECDSVGVLWNGGVWPAADVAFISVTSSLCDKGSNRSFEHCWMVLIDAGADGPLGPTTWAGAGVCIIEVYELPTDCLVEAGHWEDLRDERRRAYDILKPITIQTAR